MRPLYELLAGLSSILALGIGVCFVNVLVHELGHAIPILCWSKKKVVVYIGSLGDPGHSFRLSLGRLELYLKYNPFLWFRGLCSPGERLAVSKMIFYTAMGPLASLLITLSSFVLLKTTKPSEHQTIVLVSCMVVGGICTLSSAIPRGRLSHTYSGGGIRNDATQIIQLWKTRHLPDVYWEAMDKLRAKEYSEAAELVEKLMGEGYSSAAIYRLAVVAHFQSGQYDRAEVLQEQIGARYHFTLDDKISGGCLKIMAGRYQEAVAIYRELLRLHHNHFLILNNMGYTLVAAGEPDKALPYLDRGITLQPRFAELYANRAWAKMELGRWEEGAADAQHALNLDETSADAFRALGLYEKVKGQLATAREHFIKARSLNARVQFVEEHLADIERRLQTPPLAEK
jgi:tetratricopeptide (TPR) repeat protein